MIIKTLAFCLASSASLLAIHMALGKLQQYQAQERAAVATTAPAPTSANLPPAGVAELQAALQ